MRTAEMGSDLASRQSAFVQASKPGKRRSWKLPYVGSITGTITEVSALLPAGLNDEEFQRNDDQRTAIVEFAIHPDVFSFTRTRLHPPLASITETSAPFGTTVITANLVPGPSRKFTAVFV